RAPEPAWPDRPPLPRGPVRGPPRAREPGHRAVPRGQARARPPVAGVHSRPVGLRAAGTGRGGPLVRPGPEGGGLVGRRSRPGPAASTRRATPAPAGRG